MTLLPRPVTTDHQLEEMRLIFNECIEFMTKPLGPVSRKQQAQWWKDLPSKVVRFKAFTYTTPADFGIVAFSLLQWHKDGKITPLFGITKDARGKNLARQIIAHYLSEADGPLHGEQLKSHTAICKLNAEAGWVIERELNGVQFLRHAHDTTRSYPAYEDLDYWSRV